MAYFKKILLSTPVHLPNGQKVTWTALVGNEGVIFTEDAGLIETLRSAVAKGVGGITEIDEPTFERLKKNPASKLKKPQWQPGVMPDQINPFLGTKPSSSPSVAVSTDPVATNPESAEGKPVGRKPSVRKGVIRKSSDE